MTLSECTKADLLWIIKRIEYRYLSEGEYAVKRALGELALEKQQQIYDEAEKLAEAANQRRQQYIELIEPYVGMRLSEIPLHVLEKGAALIQEAEAFDEKWNKLMGIEV